MSSSGSWQWTAPAFASLARPEPQAPLSVRMAAAGCTANPAEPGQASEERLTATGSAQLAVRQLQAGNLHAAAGLLRAALHAAERACAVYDEDCTTHRNRRTHEQ